MNRSLGTRYAASLKQPLNGPVDHLLPDYLFKAWRWKYLVTLKQRRRRRAREVGERPAGGRTGSSKCISRHRCPPHLAEARGQRLSEHTRHCSYLNAVQKIGKGTGKRAVR